ncbi:ribosome-associated translation inhibitor RaiA [Aggregicoccus sp. 17bor-14]|uniref:ribosome hibernation-promoting factor, HPF/YfiA family n=1 Tax=Myxococcaceae TaxID=31 RepID=UPI00129C6059|nr:MULTISPECIES: ribosome-associated translation inhibitor RaiA [Myxococcaceae]MBF5045039.1 ribosome-associated translation inhibitor RaiA [Simulacricoccus sp. 17bor-14]MRI90781.1 ribosome-associated translation inhibitor RaiA [Aggregicoccus sp. 17bor-14]
MQLTITFRQFGTSEALKEYAKERVERVSRLLDRASEAHVVLSLERHLHHADITLHSGAWVLRGRDKSDDMYASIDLAMDKIERQLRRYKDKLKTRHGPERTHHHHGVMNALRVRHDVLELPFEVEETEAMAAADAPAPAAPASPPRVVRSNEFLARAMTVEDALMQMDLMGNDFLVFQNVASNEMNVVYRRKDGQYGLLEARPAAAAATAQPGAPAGAATAAAAPPPAR